MTALEPTVKDGLEAMLGELRGNQLLVTLVPCKRETNVGGCIRVPISQNSEWYRKFCARHASSRRRRNALFDTRIKRVDTVRLLERMIEGKPTTSKYAPELLRIAQQFTNTDPF